MGVPRQENKYRFWWCVIYIKIQLGYQEYQCHQGKGNHIGKKQKFHSEKKVALTQDHCFRKRRLTIQATRKLDCPVTLTVKKIFRFPEFKINEKKKNRCC